MSLGPLPTGMFTLKVYSTTLAQLSHLTCNAFCLDVDEVLYIDLQNVVFWICKIAELTEGTRKNEDMGISLVRIDKVLHYLSEARKTQ